MPADRSAALIAIGAFARLSLPAGMELDGEGAAAVTLGLSVWVGSGTGVGDAGGTGEAVDVWAVADAARMTTNGVGDGNVNGVLVGRVDCIGPQAAAMMEIRTRQNRSLARITFHAPRFTARRSGSNRSSPCRRA